MYELKLEQFAGPISKLLELIESKKLDIVSVSLAEVTADFLNYLKTIEKIDPGLLADFLVVASRLLLIKSKALLPNLEITEEEEKSIKDLEVKLKFFQEFKPAVHSIKKFWDQKNFSVSRAYLAGQTSFFYPSPNINLENIEKAMMSVFEVINKLDAQTQKIDSVIISLEEKVEEIVKRIKSGVSHFSEVAKEKSRQEIIVLFLALLHLFHQQLIKARQSEKFSDIMIE